MKRRPAHREPRSDSEEEEERGVYFKRPRVVPKAMIMKLEVTKLSGASFIVEVDPWTSIHDVKRMIRRVDGCDVASQHLYFGSVLASDTRMVQHYTNLRITQVNLVLIASATSQAASNVGGGGAQ